MTGASADLGTGYCRPARILAIHRYYWPDTPPYASILREIVRRWVNEGHNVEVLSSQPSYKKNLSITKRPRTETIDRAQVRRLSLANETGRPFVRILNAARLGIAILIRTLCRRFDVIMISTAPPVIGGFATALAAKLTGARFIYHCMDIHPEIGRLSGEFSRSSLFSLLRWMDTWSCSRADPVVVLSNDMKETLHQRPGGKGLDITVINNFELPSDNQLSGCSPFTADENSITVLFAGNVGRFQGLDAVIDAMALLKERDDIEFVIMGEGAAKSDLEAKAGNTGARVRFIGHQPVEAAKAAMRAADFGFVSLMPEIHRFAFPSKTMTYLAQGCPLIVSVDEESELARDVIGGGYGFWVPANDSESLAALLLRIASDRSYATDMSEKALAKAARKYAESVVLEKWDALLARRADTEA